MTKRMIVLIMLLSLILAPQSFAAQNQPVTMDNDYDMAASAPPIYVKHDAMGAGNGSSWDDAYTKLQDALGAANNGDQIWVAAGVYYPDEGSGQTNNDRDSTFELKNGVAVYGGFAGTQTLLDERDWETNLTVLSGDIDRDDTNKTNGVISSVGDIQGSNAYSVVTGSSTDNSAILDGVTVTAGHASLAVSGHVASDSGAGMYNSAGSPTVANTTFIGNQTADDGAPNSAANIANSGGSSSWNANIGTNSGNNIDIDPMFVQDGDLTTTPPTDGNYRLQVGSPAIDAGAYEGVTIATSATPTQMASATPTQMASATPTQMASATPTQMASATPTQMASATPTQMASATPTQMPNNQPPQLDTPIPNITVTEGAIDQVINLMEYFSDPEDDALFFTVVGNSNRDVLPSALVGQELNDFIVLKFGTPGVTTITIQAEEDIHHKTYQASFTVTVLNVQGPTLSMSKSVSTQMVEAGQEITYTLAITNSGPGMATNARISDTLPAGLTFVDGSLSATGLDVGTVSSAPPMLAEGVTLAANQSINISFAATVNPDVMTNQMITNTAQITSSEMLTPMLASEWMMTQPPSVMISDMKVTEDEPASRTKHASNAMLVVTLSKASALPVTIDYTTVPGTATADDYMPMSGTLTIEAGQTEGHINLTIMDDEQAEEDETFTIQFSNPTDATMTDAEAVITISRNDQPPTAITLTQMEAQSVLRPFDKLRAVHAQYPLRYAGALAALMLVSGCLWVMHRKEE